MKFFDLEACKKHMDFLKQYISENYVFTNCPNCGAVITSDKCEYCGTHFNVANSNYGWVSIPR